MNMSLCQITGFRAVLPNAISATQLIVAKLNRILSVFCSCKVPCISFAFKRGTVVLGVFCLIIVWALIMHQHFRIADIISMEPLNLKVIDRYRCFKKFMLNLLGDDILTIECNKNIPRAELAGACPSLDGRVERMLRCTGEFLTVDRQMNPFLRRVPECLNHGLERGFSRLGIGCSYEVADLDVLNGHVPRLCGNQRQVVNANR